MSNWKNTKNISARIINYYNDIIVLECLIDKERNIYEERDFQSSIFDNYDTKIGELFLIKYYEKPNEIKLKVKKDSSVENDFPKINFEEMFQNSRLFKK